MYSRQTKFVDFINDLKGWGACGESVLWSEAINLSKEGLTFGEAVDSLEIVKHQDWAVGSLILYENKMKTDLKKSFIRKITDPMAAFNLFIKMTTLTKEEDRMLLAIFKGKLPTAEKELEAGKIERAKK